MRLVHASYKRELLAILVVAAVGLAVSFIAAGGADARPAQQTAVVPNGTYGAAKLARGEYVVFEVRNRRVRNLEFQIQITCETSDMPGLTEQRFFTSGRSSAATAAWATSTPNSNSAFATSPTSR